MRACKVFLPLLARTRTRTQHELVARGPSVASHTLAQHAPPLSWRFPRGSPPTYRVPPALSAHPYRAPPAAALALPRAACALLPHGAGAPLLGAAVPLPAASAPLYTRRNKPQPGRQTTSSNEAECVMQPLVQPAGMHPQRTMRGGLAQQRTLTEALLLFFTSLPFGF